MLLRFLLSSSKKTHSELDSFAVFNVMVCKVPSVGTMKAIAPDLQLRLDNAVMAENVGPSLPFSTLTTLFCTHLCENCGLTSGLSQ
jgi:hypothetical protein